MTCGSSFWISSTVFAADAKPVCQFHELMPAGAGKKLRLAAPPRHQDQLAGGEQAFAVALHTEVADHARRASGRVLRPEHATVRAHQALLEAAHVVADQLDMGFGVTVVAVGRHPVDAVRREQLDPLGVAALVQQRGS